MIDPKNNSIKVAEGSTSQLESSRGVSDPSKGPINFFLGAMTSGLLGWLSLRLSQGMVAYFTLHSTNYSSAMAQSIASGFKTLVIGISFLATFTFCFIGLGLSLVFFRSLLAGKNSDPV